jgi:hypothetical protein
MLVRNLHIVTWETLFVLKVSVDSFTMRRFKVVLNTHVKDLETVELIFTIQVGSYKGITSLLDYLLEYSGYPSYYSIIFPSVVVADSQFVTPDQLHLHLFKVFQDLFFDTPQPKRLKRTKKLKK